MNEIFNETSQERFAVYERIKEPIRSYFKALAEILRGLAGFDPEDMFVRIKNAEDIKIKLYPRDGERWFYEVIEAVEQENRAFVEWGKLVSLVRDVKFYDKIKYLLSHTKMQIATEDRRFVTSAWLDFETNRANNNKILYNNIAGEIINKTEIETIINYITNNKLTQFTNIILRQLLNSNISESNKKLLKNTVDKNLRAIFSQKPLKDVSFLSKHGLVPATPLMAWDKLTEGLDISSNIIITYSTGSVIEFDIRGLIDREYIEQNSLETAEGCGLNQKMIKRFITTKAIEGKPHKWEIKVTGDGPYYIIESIADGYFRLMREANEPLRPLPGLSLINGISARSEEYHRMLGLKDPFDPAHRYIMAEVASRQPQLPTGELEEFVNRMQEAEISQDNFLEDMLKESARVFIEVFKHTNLTAYGSESLVSYLLRVEPIIEILRERLAAAINQLDLKQLKQQNKLSIIEDLSRNVIRGLIDDKTLIDYDNTFKLVYLQKRQAGVI